MSLLDKFLRVGEGKKLKALEAMVPEINAFEPEMTDRVMEYVSEQVAAGAIVLVRQY